MKFLCDCATATICNLYHSTYEIVMYDRLGDMNEAGRWKIRLTMSEEHKFGTDIETYILIYLYRVFINMVRIGKKLKSSSV